MSKDRPKDRLKMKRGRQTTDTSKRAKPHKKSQRKKKRRAPASDTKEEPMELLAGLSSKREVNTKSASHLVVRREEVDSTPSDFKVPLTDQEDRKRKERQVIYQLVPEMHYFLLLFNCDAINNLLCTDIFGSSQFLSSDEIFMLRSNAGRL